MRAVVQRVTSASVEVDNRIITSIGEGILALVGFHRDDKSKDLDYIANNILNLRIFDDDRFMNLSIIDIEGELLVVSQFTLYGDARKGRRPSYSNAMHIDKASRFYSDFLDICKLKYSRIRSGAFGENMKVSLVNSGPVTILLDSSRLF